MILALLVRVGSFAILRLAFPDRLKNWDKTCRRPLVSCFRLAPSSGCSRSLAPNLPIYSRASTRTSLG